MTVKVFDERRCVLGEGPLWLPRRRQLVWFDILSRKMLSREGETQREWQFDKMVSAAARVDRSRDPDHDGEDTDSEIIIASETELFLFNLDTNTHTHICQLEDDNRFTRSNDGRADPHGGFWIGTMGKKGQTKSGSIYRWRHRELRKLFDRISTTNSICFSDNGRTAYFTDTPTRQIMRVALDGEGWPSGEPEVFIDLSEEGHKSDGAVIDSEGCLWSAQWGSSRVARYSPAGEFLSAIELPALQTSCPAFGGDDLSVLYVTTAMNKIKDPSAEQGQTFFMEAGVRGVEEPRV
ncbi:MAG: SMP-30/gluconolactonase/LRE family protein, partial [Alphaproteobacteria bacterium]|nr:SMP-30/gluconolactonase/LRE family protein [Alphaproteobacteria bacterium]